MADMTVRHTFRPLREGVYLIERITVEEVGVSESAEDAMHWIFELQAAHSGTSNPPYFDEQGGAV